MTSRAAVDGFLAQPALAIVGMSRWGRKFGNIAYHELRARGYRVYPIHRTVRTIEGATCYPSFADLPERVDAVLVVVPPGQALDVVRDAAAAGIHHVWLQQGAQSPEVLSVCEKLRLDVVSGECILMFAQPTGVHKAHRWLWGWLGKLPRAA